MAKEQKKFIFDSYELIEGQSLVNFYYTLQKGEEVFRFKETLTFSSGVDFSAIPGEILHPALESLLLMLGISYWKIFCPEEMEVLGATLTKEQAEFWNTVYTKGLGEFFYKNKIDFRGLVKFSPAIGKTDKKSVTLASPTSIKDRSLLLFGGGKDSIVSGELLKLHQKDFTVFTLNEYPLQKNLIQLLGADSLIISRELDPKLFELNERPDAYNGHIPISAVYGFAAVLGAILYNYRYIVISNESSADEGNVEYLGETVNHQWSKSSEFEELMQNYIQEWITPELSYFSMLRPFTELKIVELFSKHSEYFSLFSSCNANFKILEPSAQKMWCGKCPKCAFVFALLAAFLPKNEVTKIFGKNLYADESLLPLYRELLGLENFKPFECVGTPEETMLAFYLAHQQKEFEQDPAMQMFVKECSAKFPQIDASKSTLLSAQKNLFVPKDFKEIIQGFRGE